MDMAIDADINIEHRLTEVEQRAKSNTNRLNEHDEILKSNSEMIGAIKELATEVKYMRGDLNETVERLNKLEGKDGDKWDKFKWLIVTGLVLQDTHLFTGTIIDNIRYGRLDATDEECIQAAKLANADGFIRMLPDGYQTIISGDGGSLSQGQRQLLAIARAAVANPPVLVLDEATSSIDTHTEELVQNGMDKLMAGRTTFVIAHRLSTIRNADCIMVLENGKIVERGNHEQLIEEKGRYYQLYTGHSISG